MIRRTLIHKKILSYLVAIAVGYLCLIFFLGDPGKDLLNTGITKDVLQRRNFLINALSQKPSAADIFEKSDMQYTGEGMLGTYAMATYALTNIAMLEPKTANESSRIIAQWIRACLKEPLFAFDKIAWLGENPLEPGILSLDRGHIGYYGHLNLMLGCYSLLNNDGQFKDLHSALSEAIARRMRKFSHRHIETYPYETYPPDNTVAAASLKIAGMALGADYKELLKQWVEESKKIEWQPYGLIVFQIESYAGKPLQTCRGSNIGWNSFFRPLVDEQYANVQFQRFKKYMLKRFPGFAAFREYPQGNLFRMDCDTGPVIFGLGGTATGFSVAGARWTKDKRLLTELLRLGELVGMSVTRHNQRRYLVAPLAGDAIMLAMKTATRWRPLWK